MENKDNEIKYRDGTRIGDKIDGSKFVRAFCTECGEPVRASTSNVLTALCNRCKKLYATKPRYTLFELMEEGLTFRHFDDRNFFDD